MPIDDNNFGMENLSSFFNNVDRNLQSVRSTNSHIDNNSKSSNVRLSKIESELKQFHKDFVKLNRGKSSSSPTNRKDNTAENLEKVAEAEEKSVKEEKLSRINFSKEQETSRKTWEKVGNSIVSGLRDAIGVFTKRVTSAFNDIRNSYLTNYADITVRLNLIESEYQDLYRDAARSFRDFNLNTQFNPDDFIKSLQGVLDVGFRGDIAERMAMQNLISKRLIPALNVNSRNYLILSKQLGEGFDKTVVAMSRYSENQLDMGPEERLNQVLDEFSTSIKYIGAVNEMSTEDVNEMISNIYLASQTVATNLSANSADILDRMIKEAATGSVSGRSILSIIGGGTADEVQEKLKTQEGTAELYSQFASALSDLGSEGGEATNVLSEALGASTEEVMTLFGDLYYSKIGSTDDLLQEMIKNQANFLSEEEYNKGITALEEGQGVNAEDSLTNVLKNNSIVENVAVIAGAVPVWNEISALVGGIWSGLSGLGYGALEGLAKKVFSGGSGSSSGLFSKIGSKVGAGGAASGAAGGAGTAATEVAGGATSTSAAGGSSAAGTAGGLSATAALQWAGGIGAAIMMAADAFKGWKETEGTKGEKAGGAVKGALLGYADINDVDSAGQAVGIVGKNTAKGALFGTAIAPGWGTLIGAVSAGLTSAIGLAVEYNTAEAKYGRSVRANLKSIKEVEEALTKVDDTYKIFSDAQSDLQVVLDENKEGTDEYSSSMDTLRDLYKTYNPLVSDNTDLTKDQIEYLKQRLELESQIALQEAKTKLAEVNFDEITSNYEEALKESQEANERGMALTEFELQMSKINTMLANEGLNYNDLLVDDNGNFLLDSNLVGDNKQLSEELSSQLGSLLSTYKSSDIISAQGADKENSSDYQLGNQVLQMFRDKESGADLSKLYTEGTQVSESHEQAVSTYRSTASDLMRILGQDFDPLTDWEMMHNLDQILGNLVDNREYSEEDVRGWDNIPSKILEREGLSTEDYKDKFGELPRFRYGLPYVPYDEYPALLHQGEAVLTAYENKDYLRDRSNFGTKMVSFTPLINAISNQTSSILNQIKSIPSPEVIIGPTDESAKFDNRDYLLDDLGVVAKLMTENVEPMSFDSITSVISDQTEIISSLIKEIINMMYATTRTKIVSNYATVSENALKFGGV